MPRVSAYRNSRPGPTFGLELSKCLTARTITAADLARVMARRKTPLSKQYIGFLVHNKRQVAPVTLDAIARALALTEPEEMRLHRAAAIDAGFKIGGL